MRKMKSKMRSKLRHAKSNGKHKEKAKMQRKLSKEEHHMAMLKRRMSKLKNKKGKAYKEALHKLHAVKARMSAKLRRAKKKGIKREKRKLGKKLHADEKKIASPRSR